MNSLTSHMLKELNPIFRLTRPAPKAITDMDKELAALLFPELVDSTKPQDVMRFQSLKGILSAWRGHYMKEHRNLMEAAQERAKEAEAELKTVRTTMSQQNVEVNQLKNDLRAAVDGRGVYENAKIAALEAEIGTLKREAIACQEHKAINAKIVIRADAEIVGLKAAIAGYERDIAQLTTACAKANEAHAATAREARAHLTEARNNLDDRWPGEKLGPFLKVVRDEIVSALKVLPP